MNSSVVQNEEALLQLNQHQNRIGEVLNVLEQQRTRRDSKYQELNGKCEFIVGFLDNKVKVLEQQGKHSLDSLFFPSKSFLWLHRKFLEIENK
jgi:hypothetical protein